MPYDSSGGSRRHMNAYLHAYTYTYIYYKTDLGTTIFYSCIHASALSPAAAQDNGKQYRGTPPRHRDCSDSSRCDRMVSPDSQSATLRSLISKQIRVGRRSELLDSVLYVLHSVDLLIYLSF